MNYMICYVVSGNNTWCIVSGEDAMQEFVSGLDDIENTTSVFEMNDELDNK